MNANVDNIQYVEFKGRYHIVVEFSQLPIETFGSKEDAGSFINGYLYGYNRNQYEQQGKMFRKFVDVDMMNGVKYRKVLPLDSVAV